MAVGLHEARVDDAWIATAAGGTAEDEVQPNAQIWIKVNAQAGNTAWADGVAYRLVVRLLNITTFAAIYTEVITGNFKAPGDKWLTQDYTFTFPINLPPIFAPAAQDTLLRVQTVLTTGVTNRGVNVFEGDLCVVTP